MSTRNELGEIIWDASRADEGSISATGANIVADAIITAGYRKPCTIATAEELTGLFALDIVLYDDSANGGLIETYIVPDDGTVMYRDPTVFHFQNFNGSYVYAKDMPLPVTLIREAS